MTTTTHDIFAVARELAPDIRVSADETECLRLGPKLQLLRLYGGR